MAALAYNAFLPIHYDEAYYWMWSKRLAWGYFDHPPMVAYVIWLTTLFSDHIFWVRLGAVLLNLGGVYFFYRFVCDIYSRDVARLASLLLVSLPAMHVGASIITPDAPLVFFWCLGLFSGWRAIQGVPRYWYITGLVIGGMVASKLTAVLFILPFCLYVLMRKRKQLTSFHPYAAACLSLLPTLGMLYWNSQQGWPNINYQLNRSGTDDLAFHLLEYFGGYLLLLTPILLWLAVAAIIRRIKGSVATQESEKFLFIFVAVIFVFFLSKAIRSGSEINWSGLVIFSLVPLIAKELLSRHSHYTAIAGCVSAMLLALLVRFPWLVGLEYPQIRTTFAVEAGVGEFAKYVQEGEVLCSDYHTMASALTYYFGNSYPVVVRFATRPSQFDLWPNSQPNVCRALVFRNKIKDYHRKDCLGITQHRQISVATSRGHRSTFQTFLCELSQK